MVTINFSLFYQCTWNLVYVLTGQGVVASFIQNLYGVEMKEPVINYLSISIQKINLLFDLIYVVVCFFTIIYIGHLVLFMEL